MAVVARYSVPYGTDRQEFTLRESARVDVVAPHATREHPDPDRAVREALAAPVSEPAGPDLARIRRARSAAIAINDKTRPVPHEVLLPPLLEWLESFGIARSAITLLIATGTHTPMQREEFESVLPESILSRYRVESHNAFDSGTLVEIGSTERGNLVTINRRFVEADLRIVVGNIEPHQFMGFSGGAKSACIGLAGSETINRNHELMNDAGAQLGRLEGNPAREEVEEMAEMLRIDFALNAVLSDAKRLVEVFAGTPDAVMRAGVPAVRQLYEVSVSRQYDLVITAPGGHPKDINLYQAQKGLAHASRVAKQGAPIVLVAACKEGTGSAAYEQWVRGMESHEEVLERFRRERFRLGPHKAFQISRDGAGRRVQLVSEMSDSLVRELLLEPAADVDTALDRVSDELPARARIAVLPYANATVPVVVYPEDRAQH